jgi:hypothetical protein
MRALKTIVATAVIVFTLTTVAMAGVQHFTKQSDDPAGAKAQQPQRTHTATQTATQLNHRMHANGDGATKAPTHTDHAQQHAADAPETTHDTKHEDGDHAWASTSSNTGHDGDDTCTPPTDGSDDGGHMTDDGEHHSGDAGEGCR